MSSIVFTKQIENNDSKDLKGNVCPFVSSNDDITASVPLKPTENSASKKRKSFAVCVITNIVQTLEDFNVYVDKPVVYEVIVQCKLLFSECVLLYTHHFTMLKIVQLTNVTF